MNKNETPVEDNYTKETHISVNNRFEMTKEGIYFAHQPIYGYRTKYADTSNIARYMVTISILRVLAKYNFSSFVDIGGAEGYTANLVKTLFHAQVNSTDLSENACKMAKKIFGIDGIPCDIHHLPFGDEQFEAVLCSETIEHVTDYKKAITELLRITSKVLVITVPHETPEIVAANIRNKIPHGHIHYFDTTTLNYLKEMGYTVSYETTLSPLLIVPRVIAEAFKKNNNKWHYKLYNSITPLLRKVFGIKTANFLVDIDAKIASTFGLYGGITFTIEKKIMQVQKNPNQKITAKDFTGITVKEFKLG